MLGKNDHRHPLSWTSLPFVSTLGDGKIGFSGLGLLDIHEIRRRPSTDHLALILLIHTTPPFGIIFTA